MPDRDRDCDRDADAEFDVVVVGAGIAGSLLAASLAPHARVLLLDRSLSLPGSTGHAPGFVGELNTVPALTALASASIALYRTIPGGFSAVGGLEVLQGQGADGVAALGARAALAQAQGVAAEVLLPGEAARACPALVRADNGGALRFPGDGTADARAIARWAQAAARASGACVREADVATVRERSERSERSDRGAGDAWTVATSGAGAFSARRVVLATGVWAGELAPEAARAALPVAHPYAYSRVRAARAAGPGPFVRFPGAHAYARDHGRRDGLGAYAHDPVHVRDTARMRSACGPWEPAFGPVLADALALLPQQAADAFAPLAPLPEGHRGDVPGDAPYAFNGLFTVTPDALPLFGRSARGVWLALGAWVTHAGGAADVLAREIRASLGHDVQRDDALARALDPRRFDGHDEEDMARSALATYNDIYNKNKA